jgi:hypothetical protein
MKTHSNVHDLVEYVEYEIVPPNVREFMRQYREKIVFGQFVREEVLWHQKHGSSKTHGRGNGSLHPNRVSAQHEAQMLVGNAPRPSKEVPVLYAHRRGGEWKVCSIASTQAARLHTAAAPQRPMAALLRRVAGQKLNDSGSGVGSRILSLRNSETLSEGTLLCLSRRHPFRHCAESTRSREESRDKQPEPEPTPCVRIERASETAVLHSQTRES